MTDFWLIKKHRIVQGIYTRSDAIRSLYSLSTQLIGHLTQQHNKQDEAYYQDTRPTEYRSETTKTTSKTMIHVTSTYLTTQTSPVIFIRSASWRSRHLTYLH
jgi:hypothetical protein